MRVVNLLLIGLLPLFINCPAHSQKSWPGKNKYDSLAKYTYLLIGLKTVKAPGLKGAEIANSSGFFMRKDKRLFLVSAYHVITGCGLWKKGSQEDRPDSLKVWYVDTLNNYTSTTIPLDQKPCGNITNTLDVDMIEVTDSFKNARIFSVEGLLPDPAMDNPDAQLRERVACYGYFNDGSGRMPPKEGDSAITPTGIISRVVRLKRRLRPLLGAFYSAAIPAFRPGYSGAPVFRLGIDSIGRARITVAGVQSSNRKHNTRSMFVRYAGLAGPYQSK